MSLYNQRQWHSLHVRMYCYKLGNQAYDYCVRAKNLHWNHNQKAFSITQFYCTPVLINLFWKYCFMYGFELHCLISSLKYNAKLIVKIVTPFIFVNVPHFFNNTKTFWSIHCCMRLIFPKSGVSSLAFPWQQMDEYSPT